MDKSIIQQSRTLFYRFFLPPSASAADDSKRPADSRPSPDSKRPADSRPSPDSNRPTDSRLSPDSKRPTDSRLSPDSNRPTDSRPSPDSKRPPDSRPSPDSNRLPDSMRPPGPFIPVVLLHGFAEDGAIWDQQIDHLKKNFPLIIPDLPGSGRSSPLTAATSMEKMADAVVALLDAEKIGQCILIGHSMGGYIALAFVEKYAARCKGFGLFHSTAYPDTEEKKTTRRKSMAFIRKHGAAEFIRQSTPNLFSDDSRERHPEWISGITERFAGFDPDSLIHYYQAMIDRPDRSAVLRQSHLPTLLVIGRHDNTIPFETALQQSHMPSLAFIHILEEAGHMGMIEASARSNRILSEFLSFLATRADPSGA